MRTFQVTGLLAAAILLSVPAMRATAEDSRSGPVVGVDIGPAIPISNFQKVARVGGTVGPFLGYRLGSENIAITPMIQPQFSFFPAKDQNVTFTNADAPMINGRVVRQKIVKSTSQNLFSITGGLRISLYDETREIYLGGQGGYYTDMGGPVRGAGGGFNVQGGLNYRLTSSTAVGIFIRRDEAYMSADLQGDKNLVFLMTGIGVTHMFAAPKEAPPPPPPAVAAPAPTPAPEVPPVKKKIVLRGVNFDFDKAVIRADAEPILDEAARVLKESGEANVAVEGYTDSVGTDSYNQTLSVRRANAVRDYLEGHGVAGDRLTVEGFGETKPVASNDTSEGRAQNRRVELQVAE